MRKMVIGLVTCLVILIGLLVVINKTTQSTEETTVTNEETTQAINGIEQAKENLAAISNENNPVATIVLEHNKESYEFTFELFPEKAPQSVYNFISLANSGFYNNLTIHRLIPNFVMQGGDPDGNGSGGPGYTIKGEFPSNGVTTDLTHQVGAIAMARSQHNDSAGSQFYIVLNDGVQYLDDNYAVFGYMIDGYEQLEYFNAIPTATGDVPQNPVTITSVEVDTKGIDYPEPDKIEASELES